MNQEIAKQHRQGQKNLPPLQPPGSLDGFEMFGFSSPAIVQVNKKDDATDSLHDKFGQHSSALVKTFC